jgi:hypothetical protein
MSLHLVIAGLLWPRENLREACRNLALPALETLLGRSQRALLPASRLGDWLADAFGIDPGERPWGALRRRGEADGAAGGACVCADPVQLRFVRDTLVLVDSRELAITRDEAQALVAALNGHFPDIGRFDAVTPQRWYLWPARPPRLVTHATEEVIGHSFDVFLPEGEDARAWRVWLNEAQMLMHAHPVNAAREEAGRPTVNSVWPWGSAALGGAPRSPWQQVFAADPLVIGLARAAGIEARPPAAPAALAAAAGHDVGAVIDSLQAPMLYRDAAGWRAALTALERDWLAPALAAVYAGTIGELRLTALGDAARVDATLGPQDRWRFWRRPLALAALLPPA